MSTTDWQEIIGVISVFTLITVVAARVIRQLGTIVRAKAAVAREEGFRKLAEQSLTAQQATERQLTELRLRMESMERILKEVE